ncbi:hypothetical protein DXG01_010692 [Tephrocybe rancida]|nr:hypothetical protein DXG01_010692 [Tephrocybe rancida]
MNFQHEPLPLDLLELIFDLVLSTSDLLSLALTSKQLCGLIIPNHLHFRRICCDFKRPTFWHALAAESSAASRCHELKILWGYHDEEKQRIPLNLRVDFEKDKNAKLPKKKVEARFHSYLEALAGAIQRMPRLTSFIWRGNQPPSSAIYAALLASCPRLAHVDLWLVYEQPNVQPSQSIANLAKAPFRRLSNLTQFAFTDHLNPATSDAHMKILTAILLACDRLEDLYIKMTGMNLEFVEAAIHNIFQTARWKHLRRLTLLEIGLHEALEAFFHAHPRLERLYIRHNSNTRAADVALVNLPRLKSLDTNYLPEPMSHISSEVLRSLTHFGAIAGSIASEATRLQEILALTPNLTSLALAWIEYTPEWLPSIAACVPRLERLGVRWMSHDNAVELMRKDISPWHRALELLPNLTHLGTICLAAFSPPRDESWKTQGWVTQGVGLEHRISNAVKQICSTIPTTRLERIHFISDMNGLNDIWVFLDPFSHQVKQFAVLEEDSPEGLIPWSACYSAGLDTRLNPIGSDCNDPSILPIWPY